MITKDSPIIADLHSFRFDNEECTVSVSMVKTVWL